MKLRTLVTLTLLSLSPAVWSTDIPATSSAGEPPATAAPATAAYPAYNTFNWFDPNAWMAMFFNPAYWNAGAQPPASNATPAQNPWQGYGNTGYAGTGYAGYPTGSFNWFDPNAWMGLFFNPANWTQPLPTTTPAK